MWVQNNGYVYMWRFEGILKFLAKRDIGFVTMSEEKEGSSRKEIDGGARDAKSMHDCIQ